MTKRPAIAMGAMGAMVTALAVATVLPARADPACGVDALSGGPLLSGPGPADFGQMPAACVASDLALRLRGTLLVDEPDFYGAVAAAGTLRGRYRLGERWSASAALDLFTWRYTVNAVVASHAWDVGPMTVGAQRILGSTNGAAILAAYARALLPFDTARRHGLSMGAELGLTAMRRLGRAGVVQGGMALPAVWTVVGGVSHGSLGPALVGEAVWSPWTWVAFSGGAAARTQVAPEADLVAVSARPSVSFASRGGWFFALAGEIPVFGRDRTDALVSAFVGRP